jgi:hypothetical protein
MRARLLGLGIFLLLVATARPARADIFDTITNAITGAANTTGNAISSAANTVGNGLDTAVNATAKGLNIAANKTGEGLNTAFNAVEDAYNVSYNTVKNFTQDVREVVDPAATSVSNAVEGIADSVVNVTTSTYRGAVNYGRDFKNQGTGTVQDVTVDALNATSILESLQANSSGFIAVANSLLVALGQNKSSEVESAIKNLVNNSTGEISYPATPLSQNDSLSLAQAIVTALVTAENYTVTVDFNGAQNTVNGSEVVAAYIAGLQDGLTPCARNVTSSNTTTVGSSDYFNLIAQRCCFLVSKPLVYTAALSQSNSVGPEFDDALANSQRLGSAPAIDLTRCVANSTITS